MKSTNRITREDIIRLKLKKKRKIRFIISTTLCILLILGIVGYTVVKKHYAKDAMKGGQIDVGIQADIGIGHISRIDYSDIAVDEEIATTVPVLDPETISAIEFVVPETSLAPVEEIEGNNWYNDAIFERASEEPVDLNYFTSSVFIGDSRSEGLILYSGLPHLNGFCYKGLSVDKLTSDQNIYINGYSGKYSCYQAISMTSYDSYYCMFGINELGWVSIDAFIEDFSAMLDHILSVNPDAIIYVESILPVSKEGSESSDVYKQERINEFNTKILEMCMTRGDVIYLDIASAVMGEDGYLPSEASGDGIHCNADYCKRVIQYIRCNTYKKK